MGRIPLAVTQAATFMRGNKMSLEKYSSMLEKDEQNLKDSLSMVTAKRAIQNTEGLIGGTSEPSLCAMNGWVLLLPILVYQEWDGVRAPTNRNTVGVCF
jgi:hypothetical protein